MNTGIRQVNKGCLEVSLKRLGVRWALTLGGLEVIASQFNVSFTEQQAQQIVEDVHSRLLCESHFIPDYSLVDPTSKCRSEASSIDDHSKHADTLPYVLVSRSGTLHDYSFTLTLESSRMVNGRAGPLLDGAHDLHHEPVVSVSESPTIVPRPHKGVESIFDSADRRGRSSSRHAHTIDCNHTVEDMGAVWEASAKGDLVALQKSLSAKGSTEETMSVSAAHDT